MVNPESQIEAAIFVIFIGETGLQTSDGGRIFSCCYFCAGFDFPLMYIARIGSKIRPHPAQCTPGDSVTATI